jgi:hypothetical protein
MECRAETRRIHPGSWNKPLLMLAVITAITSCAWCHADEPVDYLRDVKPLLTHRCYACHGALKQSGGLRLDTASLARQGGDSGEVIDPHDPDASLLLGVVTGEAGYRMPPEGEGAELTAEEITILRRWIASGAPGPDDEPQQEDPTQYWSFRDMIRPNVPETRNPAWVRNPIDAFIARQHEARDLTPSPEADRTTLLRRVYLDLIGIPPTRRQVTEFLADTRSDAYEQVVEQLLNSPLHGQRWGRHWMDVWRYSDWYGSRGINQIRYGQRHAWRWRDWIVESLNADKGYDQMIREMLAGDELRPGDPDVMRATGFIGRNWYKFDRDVWMFDAVEHTSQAFLGLTLRCCRCHDHKFDPISQEEYYRFRAFFEPHHVRTDPLSANLQTEMDTGEPVLLEGVSLVYDKELDVPTYLFQRGDSRYPDESKPLKPGVPSALGGSLPAIAPVSLPIEGFYPSLRDELVNARQRHFDLAMDAARRERDEQLVTLDQLRARMRTEQRAIESGARRSTSEPADAAPPRGELVEEQIASPHSIPTQDDLDRQWIAAQRQLELCEQRLALAEADRARFAALVAAERLKAEAEMSDERTLPEATDGLPPARDTAKAIRDIEAENLKGTGEPDGDASSIRDSNAHKASLAAGQAERRWKLAQAQLALLEAKQQQHLVREASYSDDAARGKDEKQAREKVDAAEKQLADTQQELGQPKDPAAYTPLGPSYPRTSSGRRRALADWLASPDNRRTARVAVNHVWLRHFGEGIVPSVANFGLNGQSPSHPELLDWLASELTDNNWSLKHLHRLMVLSATYRMASSDMAAELNHPRDPDNRWLWRMNSRRLESEAVRDSVLHVAGELDVSPGGPEISESQGMENRRRSMYFRSTPNETMLFLDLFDQANPNECYRRQESVIPQQALALNNSPLALNAARHLAARLSCDPEPDEQWVAADGKDEDGLRGSSQVDESGADEIAPDRFIDRAFWEILSRAPSAEESAACLRFLDRQTKLLQQPGTPYAERIGKHPARRGGLRAASPRESGACAAEPQRFRNDTMTSSTIKRHAAMDASFVMLRDSRVS